MHHHGRKGGDAARDPDGVDHHDHDPIVELEYYGRGVTADIVMGKLKANGLSCYSQAEPGAFAVAWDPLGKSAQSVHVFQSDLARARALIEDEEA